MKTVARTLPEQTIRGIPELAVFEIFFSRMKMSIRVSRNA